MAISINSYAATLGNLLKCTINTIWKEKNIRNVLNWAEVCICSEMGGMQRVIFTYNGVT